MSNTSIRKELFGLVDDILKKVGMLESTNVFLNSEQVKGALSERYDKTLKKIENMHEKAPEKQKAKSKEVIEKIKSTASKEHFVERIAESFKTGAATIILKLNLLESEELARNQFEGIKTELEEEPKTFIETLNAYAENEEKEIFQLYIRETYTGYLLADTPEEIAVFLTEFMNVIGAIHIPLELISGGSDE